MSRPSRNRTEANPAHQANDQADTDPLPYTQVDRAVKPVASLIASRLGIPFQHALGGLVEFWQLSGDPRDLEAMIAAGKSEIVLDRDEVSRRFALAMGVDTGALTPEDLASLRLLERRSGDTFRVRGMSRYFAPLKRRVAARLAASAGGKASAKVRAEKHGTAQPRSRVASASASEVASESASAPLRGHSQDLEAAPKRYRTQRSAVSGQPTAISPLPPSAEGGSDERTCRCTRRPCRHEVVLPIKFCAACDAACGSGDAATAYGGALLCYRCIPLAQAWAREQNPAEPFRAGVAAWAEDQRRRRASA